MRGDGGNRRKVVNKRWKIRDEDCCFSRLVPRIQVGKVRRERATLKQMTRGVAGQPALRTQVSVRFADGEKV